MSKQQQGNQTDQQVAKLWNKNATAWTTMARGGFDIFRNHLNTPAFMDMLPDVGGMKGLDIGCGEGYNTRLVAGRGAHMTGIDLSETFIEFAKDTQSASGTPIEYFPASATALPFADQNFDFAIATMSMMDIPDTDLAIREAYRVVRPGGFFQFSICHPCFQTLKYEWKSDPQGNIDGLICGDYFQNGAEKILEWTFSSAPEEVKNQFEHFVIPTYFKTLSDWVNTLIATGFAIEHLAEPRPDKETMEKYPDLKRAAIVALFLHIRCRKPL